MKKENRNMKKNRQILVLAALLFSFLCFPADKVLAASNVVEVPLTVKQNFEENSNEKGIDLTGTYEFRALDIGILCREILITTDMFLYWMVIMRKR